MTTVTSGTVLGHYKILAPLGAGGMGEVWLAEDTTLKRKVALKLLPAAVAGHPERLARFQREAEAIAALSHPNIVTIYSVQEDAGVRFLTMEFVDGQALDAIIPRGGLPLAQVLDIGIALGDALAASHEKGIIHRDLKPANIMLAGRERRVKVLDFGLAKLRDEAAPVGEMTTAAISTEGRILGTVAYMSPEQAEAKPTDARSDVFSLGIVLYELATGERPFKGETSISVLSAILRDTPKSVTELRADLPWEFARIIRQCLQKDPEERYQTAKDLRNQLRILKADVESGEVNQVASGARFRAGGATIRRGRRFNRRRVFAAAGLLLLVIAATISMRLRSAPASAGIRPFDPILLTPLTDNGRTGVGAISPDGRYLAYSTRDEAAHEVLWLRQVRTGSEVQIVPLSATLASFEDVTFTPDADYLYCVSFRSKSVVGEILGENQAPALYRIPTLGGAAQRIVGDVTSVRVSPDGSRIAYVKSPSVDTRCASHEGPTDDR